MAKQLAELQAWKAERAALKLNPSKFLQGELGETWYDTLTQHKLQGAPTGDVIASELQAQDARLEAKLAEREKAYEAKFQALETREAEAQRREYEASVLAHIKANAGKYPGIAHFGEEASVLRMIEAHFNSTLKRRPDGQVEPGELLTPDAAAERVEKSIADIVEKVLKFKSPPAPKPPEAPSSKLPRTGAPQRRSMSTEFTAPQGSWTPPKDDRERMQRAFAAADRDFEARQARH